MKRTLLTFLLILAMNLNAVATAAMAVQMGFAGNSTEVVEHMEMQMGQATPSGHSLEMNAGHCQPGDNLMSGDLCDTCAAHCSFAVIAETFKHAHVDLPTDGITLSGLLAGLKRSGFRRPPKRV